MQIVGITDEDEATVKKFQKQIPMDYNVAINTPGSTFEQFGVTAIPTAFLVDKSGKIVWTGHPMELSESRNSVGFELIRGSLLTFEAIARKGLFRRSCTDGRLRSMARKDDGLIRESQNFFVNAADQ